MYQAKDSGHNKGVFFGQMNKTGRHKKERFKETLQITGG